MRIRRGNAIGNALPLFFRVFKLGARRIDFVFALEDIGQLILIRLVGKIKLRQNLIVSLREFLFGFEKFLGCPRSTATLIGSDLRAIKT